jgi:hypothetical protein
MRSVGIVSYRYVSHVWVSRRSDMTAVLLAFKAD